MSDLSWRFQAKCANDPVVQEELHRKDAYGQNAPYDRFHDRHGKNQEVTKYCKGIGDNNPCPVISECFFYALSLEGTKNPDGPDSYFKAHGIWGGSTPHQRAHYKSVVARQQTQILDLVERMKEQSQGICTPTEDVKDVPA